MNSLIPLLVLSVFVSCQTTRPSLGLSAQEIRQTSDDPKSIHGLYCEGKKQIRKFEIRAFLPVGICKGRNVVRAQQVLAGVVQQRSNEASGMLLENFLVNPILQGSTDTREKLAQYDWCSTGRDGQMILVSQPDGSFVWATQHAVESLALSPLPTPSEVVWLENYIVPPSTVDALEGAIQRPRNAAWAELSSKGDVRIAPVEGGLFFSVQYDLTSFCRGARMKGDLLAH